MKKCIKYEGLIERYVAGEILPEERDDLEKHLALCHECSSIYSGVSEIDSILKDIPGKEIDPPPHLKSKIVAKLEEVKPVRDSSFPFSPAYAAAAALMAIVLVGVYGYFSRPTVIKMAGTGTGLEERQVDYYVPQFRPTQGERVVREVRVFFYNPDAKEVSITGDFTNWDPEGLPLKRTGKKGLWEVDLKLWQGVYSYNFIIDGRLIVPDPNSLNQAPDGFGGMNSVMYVSREEMS